MSINTVLTIIYAIIILLVLIFAHELGHLISAKITGVRVNEFALGMGPKLFGFVKGETKYTFRAVPFGGFCAFEGEEEESEDPRAFLNKPARIRAFVLFAGSVMNILLAILLLSLSIFGEGQYTRVLDTVDEESQAFADGLRPGDELLSINGIQVSGWNDIANVLIETGSADPDATLTLGLMRDGGEMTIETHFYTADDGRRILGITPRVGRSVSFFFKSFGYGAQYTGYMAKEMYNLFGDLFTGKAGVEMLTGPVGIVVTVGDVAPLGFIYLVQLTALISLNLGIVNLLPFPALDGGRLLFLLIRKITGKAITNELEGRVHLIGILVLLGFLAFITLKDIDRFIIK